MPINNWGLETKSLVDPTLIEERITAMIAEHNDDPTAHMADDQSIGLHRVNDIIDHPAGSVVADKNTMTELVWQDFFTDMVTWNLHGNTYPFGGGGVDLNFEGDVTPTQIYGAPYDGNFSVVSTSDFTAQYCTMFGRDGNVSRFLLGITETISYTANSNPSVGFYFEMINNSLRGKARYGGNVYQTDAYTPANWEFIILRIFWDHTAKTLSFFINGALLGTLTLSDFTGSISYPLMARVESASGGALYAMTLLSCSFTRYFAPPF